MTRQRNNTKSYAVALSAFLFGCIFSSTIILNYVTLSNAPSSLDPPVRPGPIDRDVRNLIPLQKNQVAPVDEESPSNKATTSGNPLDGQRILIAIAAFDFSQIPHLGEVLDSYQDLCLSGASKVDVVIHSTVAYPVTLIDMLNSRLLPECKGVFSTTIAIKNPTLRLHLVDCHRELFYQKIDDYDLFIYTEDDIRVPPRVVGAYLGETKRVQDMVGMKRSEDYNVGIVRYEYNYPSNQDIDDKTRHATQNVTRVYWEHGQWPIMKKAVHKISEPEFGDSYVTMDNAHQGMFLATRFLLKAWKKRCSFDIATNRPGKKNDPHQPLLGTQRVWMSSHMLYSPSKGCGVKQVLPARKFGTLTVLHLPNKNYRRVGHFRNRTFSDGTEKFDFGSSSLISEMVMHIELTKATKQVPTIPYDGIRMVDEITNNSRRNRSPMLERRLGEYQAYADRGGILTEQDMTKTALVEER